MTLRSAGSAFCPNQKKKKKKKKKKKENEKEKRKVSLTTLEPQPSIQKKDIT